MQSIKSPIVVWAVLLFFGFPLVGELIIRLSLHFFGDTWDQSSTDLWTIADGLLLTPFVLHAVSYLFVRRLDHQVLSHLWLYAIITGAIAIVYRLVVAPFDSFTDGMYRWLFVISIIFSIADIALLVWFARRVSAITFGHALLFIGLVVAMESPGTFIPLNFLYPSTVSVPYSSVLVAMAAVHVIVKAAGVWSLVNQGTITSSMRNLLTLVSLFILIGGLQLGVSVGFNDPFVDRMSLLINILTGIGQLIIQYGVAALLAYAVRVREPLDRKGRRSTPQARWKEIRRSQTASNSGGRS